jgi:hypothetical protein
VLNIDGVGPKAARILAEELDARGMRSAGYEIAPSGILRPTGVSASYGSIEL